MSLEEHMQQLSITSGNKAKKSTQTTYRYHINTEEHYTAVQLNDEIMEVKGPHAGTKYPSLDKWMESIGAREDQLEITEEKKSKRKANEKKSADTTDASAVETKPKKIKVEKLKMDIPTKRSSIISTRWMRHVYEMMVEANVTITDEIIHAFNNVMKCLKKYPQVSTSTPPKVDRYRIGFQLKMTNHYIHDIFLHFEYTTPYDARQVIADEIMQTYTPLYELTKHIVEPYMKKKHLYTHSVRLLEKNKAQMLQLHEQAEELIKKHEDALSLTYRHIEDKRREIRNLEDAVVKFAM